MKYLLKNIQAKFIFFVAIFMLVNIVVNAQGGAFTEFGSTTGSNSPLAITVHGTVYVGHGTFNTPSNTAIGVAALAGTTTGFQNTGIGFNALTALLSGTNNTAVGSFSLTSITTGAANSAFGNRALSGNIAGNNNTAMGDAALLQSNGGNGANNAAFGSSAGWSLTTGVRNTFIGTSSGFAAVGNDNTAIGNFSLNTLVTGNNNIALGSSALQNLTNGSYNVAIGYQAIAPTATSNNTLTIQRGIYGLNMDNQTNSVIGIGMVPIGTPSTPGNVVPPGTFSKLHVGGTSTTIPSLQLDYVPTGTSTTGKYLFVDPNGVVSQSQNPVVTNSCLTTGTIPRVTDGSGNMGCSQIVDDNANVGIGLGGGATTAKLDIELIAGTTPGTVRLRHLQVNPTNVELRPVLIDDNGFLWKASASHLSRNSSPKDQEIQNDKIDKLEAEVKNLKELVELMMKNGNTVSVIKPFTVYPNPAKNIVRIEKSEKAATEANQYVEIRDINNQVVLEKQIFKQSLNITLDNKLVSGTYLLVIYQNQQIIQTEKITIAK